MKRATSGRRFLSNAAADKGRRVFSNRIPRPVVQGGHKFSPGKVRPIDVTENNTPFYVQDTNCNTSPLAFRVEDQLPSERNQRGSLPMTYKTQVHSPVPPEEVSVEFYSHID